MRWVAALGLSLLLAGTGQAASIQVRLIRASNEGAGTDAALADIAGKLREKFGYQFYQQLGSQQQALRAGATLRMDLGENFRVLVKPRSAQKREQELELEWYSGRTLLVRSVVKIVENGHLLVKGPEVGNDWIVLAVSVRN